MTNSESKSNVSNLLIEADKKLDKIKDKMTFQMEEKQKTESLILQFQECLSKQNDVMKKLSEDKQRILAEKKILLGEIDKPTLPAEIKAPDIIEKKKGRSERLVHKEFDPRHRLLFRQLAEAKYQIKSLETQTVSTEQYKQVQEKYENVREELAKTVQTAEEARIETTRWKAKVNDLELLVARHGGLLKLLPLPGLSPMMSTSPSISTAPGVSTSTDVSANLRKRRTQRKERKKNLKRLRLLDSTSVPVHTDPLTTCYNNIQNQSILPKTTPQPNLDQSSTSFHPGWFSYQSTISQHNHDKVPVMRAWTNNSNM